MESLSDFRELGELARLDVLPGDKFVLMTDNFLSLEQARRVGEMWGRYAPGSKLLVLDGGMKLGAVREVDNATS